MKQENKFLIVAGIFVIALVIGHYQFGLFSITGVVGDVKISYQSMQPGCVVRLDRLGEATFVGVYDVASQGKKNADMASKIGWITNETYSDAITFLRDHPPDSSCVAIGAEHQCEIGDSKCCGNTNIHCIDGTGNIQFICEPLSGNGSLWVNYGPSTSCFSCTPSWQTGSWSTCTSGTQTRTVTDSNNCGTTEGKPATTQTCTVTCTPDNSCQANTCIGSTCTNNCGTVLQGTKDCSTTTQWYLQEILKLGDFSVKLWMLIAVGGAALLIILLKKK